MGPAKTARQLEANQIPTPSYSCYEKYGVKLTGLDPSRTFAWSPTSVTNILDNARKYTEINELTPELLPTFIKRIEVGERAKKYSHSAPQDIVIHYRDIGIVDDMPQEIEDILRQVAEIDGDVTYTFQESVYPTDS